MQKIVRDDNEVLLLQKEAIDECADLVKKTYGNKGKNITLERKGNPPLVTCDGYYVLRELKSDNPHKQVIIEQLKDGAKKVAKEAGDSTTGYIVLVQKLYDIAFNQLQSKGLIKSTTTGDEIWETFKRESKEVIEKLNASAEKITTDEQLLDIASISAKSRELGEIVFSVVKKIGHDGLVRLEDSFTDRIETEIVSGMEIWNGYVSPYMATEQNKDLATIHNARVLVTNEDINNPQQILGIIEKLQKEKIYQLALFAPSFSRDMIGLLVATKVQGAFTVVGVQVPSHNNYLLEDISALVGANYLTREIKPLAEATLEDLGNAEKIESTSAKTTILGGKGNTEKRVARLKEELEKQTSEFEKQKTKERIGKLTNGIAIIRVGAKTDTERDFIKPKLEDAIHTAQKSMEHGIVRGGGLALSNLAGGYTIDDALKAPHLQLLTNGTKEIGDNIYDSKVAIIASLEQAVSMVGGAITSGGIVAEEKEDKCCQNHKSVV